MHKQTMTLWILFILDLTAVALLNAAVIEGLEKETGELTLSEDQFTVLISGQFRSIEVRKTADHQYNALSPIADDGIPQPMDRCRERFDQYIFTHSATFQAGSNRYCRPIRGCWCCSNFGLCIAFFVNPTGVCGTTANEQRYLGRIPVFEV